MIDKIKKPMKQNGHISGAEKKKRKKMIKLKMMALILKKNDLKHTGHTQKNFFSSIFYLEKCFYV